MSNPRRVPTGLRLEVHLYVNGVAAWPEVGINYTTKTQYLFRINKGIDNYWNNVSINSYMPEDERPIPFDRMNFLGDGDTDIPTMKMLTHKGGHSVAVYDPNRTDRYLKKVHKLISDGRVEFVRRQTTKRTPRSTLS